MTTMASNGVWGFMGVAIGIAMTMVAWWLIAGNSTAYTPFITDNQSAEISRSHSYPNATVILNDDVIQLSERVRYLTDKVADLGVTLLRLQVLADSIDAIEDSPALVVHQQQSIVDTSEPVFDQMEPTAAGVADTIAERPAVFTPTHTVNAKLNLRPSASLDTKPIGMLTVGARVEVIGEDGDWYHVNTQSIGKGWCYSSYLSPYNVYTAVVP